MKVPNWWTLSQQSQEAWTPSEARACRCPAPAPPEAVPPQPPPPQSLLGFCVATAHVPVRSTPHEVPFGVPAVVCPHCWLQSHKQPLRELRRNEVVQVVAVQGPWMQLRPMQQRWAKKSIDPAIATPVQLGMHQPCVIERVTGCVVAPADPKWALVSPCTPCCCCYAPTTAVTVLPAAAAPSYIISALDPLPAFRLLYQHLPRIVPVCQQAMFTPPLRRPMAGQTQQTITVHEQPNSSSAVVATLSRGQVVQLEQVDSHGSWRVERKR